MNKHDYLTESLWATLAELDKQTDPSTLAVMLKQKMIESFSLHRLWQYRPYLYNLSKEQIHHSNALLAASAIIASMEGKLDTATALLAKLPESSSYYYFTKLILPTTTWHDFNDIAKLMEAKNLNPFQNLPVTAGRPYVLNGFRDFSSTLTEIIGEREQFIALFQRVYGPHSLNAITVAQAEAEYLRDDCFPALTKIVGLLPTLTGEKDAQVLFPALYLQMVIMIMSGQVSTIAPMIASLRSQLFESNRDEWLPNVDALEAHAALYSGDYAKVAIWMRNCAPDEHNDFCMLDLYRYLVKLRVYLVLEKHLAFLTLAVKLLPLLQACNRCMDECELQMLWAICAYNRSDNASMISHISRALELSEAYRYDRLLADEGEQLLRVLLLYRKEQGSSPYLNRIINLTRKTASLYPRYLKTQLPETPALSDTELVVLRFLADGRSNADIAELLDVKVDTVKAHCKHIATKLQTKNRHQSVTRAIELGIIEPVSPRTSYSDAAEL